MVVVNSVSRLVVTAVARGEIDDGDPGWVVVLAFAASGAHSPVAPQAPAADPTPHWASVVQLCVQTPFTRSQVEVAPNARAVAR